MSARPSRSEFKRLTGKRAQLVRCQPVVVGSGGGGGGGGEVKLTLRVTLPPSTDWTSGATSAWQVIPGKTCVCTELIVLHMNGHTSLKEDLTINTIVE